MVACEGMPKLWERGWKNLLPENRAQLLEEATTLHSRGELFAKHRGTVPEFPPGEDELAEAILEPAFGGQDGDEEVEEDEVPVFAVLEDDEEDAEAPAAEAEGGAGVPAAEAEAEAEAPAAEARAEEPMAEVVAAMSRFMALRIVYGGRMPKK